MEHTWCNCSNPHENITKHSSEIKKAKEVLNKDQPYSASELSLITYEKGRLLGLKISLLLNYFNKTLNSCNANKILHTFFSVKCDFTMAYFLKIQSRKQVQLIYRVITIHKLAIHLYWIISNMVCTKKEMSCD